MLDFRLHYLSFGKVSFKLLTKMKTKLNIGQPIKNFLFKDRELRQKGKNELFTLRNVQHISNASEIGL